MRYVRGAAAVAAIATFAVSGGTAYARERVTLTGTYQLVAKQLDDGSTRGHGHAYQDVLVAGERSFRLRLGDRPRPRGGSTVRVSATTVAAGEYEVASIETLSEPAAVGGGTTSTLAILAYWTAPDAVTPQRARDQLFGDDNAWMREASYGQVSLTGAVTPWVKIAAPTSGRCFDYATQIRDRARAGARTLGYDYQTYHRTLVYFPKCTSADTTGLAGWAYEPGDSIWLNGVMDRRTSVHEHGHSFGLPHARAYDCTSNGLPVTLGGSCVALEYGDPYDAMGQSTYVGHFTGMNKDRIGWLGARKHVVMTPSSSFTLAPFERVSATPVVAVVNSPVSGRRYWLEFRQPVGMDARFPAGGTAGIQIHLDQNGLGPYLLDPTPSDASFTTAVLGAGRSWTAPDGVRVAVGTVSSTGATVSVSGAQPVPVPPSEPRDVHAVAGDMRATLHWSAPASPGYSEIVRYDIQVSNGQSQVVAADTRSATFTGLTNGQLYTFTVRAVNEAGRSPGASATATPFFSPPTVSITSPAPGSTVSGRVTFTAAAAPGPGSGAALTKVDWYVGNLVTAKAPGEPFVWDTDPYADGSYTVKAVAVDANNRSAAATATYVVTNVRPVVRVTSPVNGATVTGGIVTLAADVVAAEGSEIDRVEFTDGYGRSLGVARTAPYQVAWDVTTIDGYVAIRAKAYDTAGLSGTAPTVGVTVTHPPPTLTITSPAQNQNVQGTTVTVTADAAPGTPGTTLSRVTFYSGGRSYTATEAPYTARIDTSGYTGWMTVEARALESTGRVTSRTVGFNVANALPDVRVASPAWGASLTGSSVTLTGTAVPRTGGAPIARIELTAPNAATVTVVPAADGSWSAAWPVAGRYGSTYVEARAVDTGGMWSKATAYFTVQRPTPDVQLVSPVEGTVLAMSEPFDLVATAVPSPDATASIHSVCFVVYSYQHLGCGTHQPDGTYVLRGAVLSSWNSSVDIQVVVIESDNHANLYDRTFFDVLTPPGAPVYVWAEPDHSDGTVVVSWAEPAAGPPVDGFVVRTWHGIELGRSATSPLRVRPPDAGVEQQLVVHAVNRAGESYPAVSNEVTPGIATRLVMTSVSATSVTSPGRITVRGRLTRLDGTPVRGSRLQLHAIPIPESYWSTGTESALLTDAYGYATLSFQPQFHAMVSLEHTPQNGYLRSTSAAVRVDVRAGVSGNLTRGLMPLGATSSMNGTVSPAYQGRFVYLQRFYAGMWRTVTYRKQDASGRVSIPITPTARGTYPYRLYYGGDARVSGNVSPQRTLTVY